MQTAFKKNPRGTAELHPGAAVHRRGTCPTWTTMHCPVNLNLGWAFQQLGDPGRVCPSASFACPVCPGQGAWCSTGFLTPYGSELLSLLGLNQSWVKGAEFLVGLRPKMHLRSPSFSHPRAKYIWAPSSKEEKGVAADQPRHRLATGRMWNSICDTKKEKKADEIPLKRSEHLSLDHG